MKLTILGSGRGAGAIGGLFSASGQIEQIGSRNPKTATPPVAGMSLVSLADAASQASELLLFAVPDDSIQPVYETYQHTIPARTLIFHLSGSMTSGVFHRHRGFSLHPLRSLPPAGERVDLSDALFVWEGHSVTEGVAREIVSMAGGRFAAIDPTLKALYHSAAVFGSNYVAVLLEEANRLMGHAGVVDARGSVGELAISAIRNWMTRPDAPFTGPVARGDAETIEANLIALEEHPESKELYRLLGSRLIDAIEQGGQDPRLKSIRELFRDGSTIPLAVREEPR